MPNQLEMFAASRVAIEQIEEIAGAAAHAILEAGEIAYNLRPLHIDRLGLTAANGSGLGLLGLTERARILGGWLTIPSAPGQGTMTYLRFPFSNLLEQHNEQ